MPEEYFWAGRSRETGMRRNPDNLLVSQIFGPTIQGEGSAAGRHCIFLRLWGCNLECTWCDTPYTWATTPKKAAKTQSGKLYDKDEPKLGAKEMDYFQVVKALGELWPTSGGDTILVVSGGEPLMQQVPLTPIVKGWNGRLGREVHIETAGTIAVDLELNKHVTQYNVSPKLAHSGNVPSKRYKPAVLKQLVGTEKAWFKFVVAATGHASSVQDQLEEIDHIVKECDIDPARVMLMPEGTTGADIGLGAQRIVDMALARGYGLSLRTHILLWGNDPTR